MNQLCDTLAMLAIGVSVLAATAQAADPVVYLDGERIFGPAGFNDRHRTMPLRHMFPFPDGVPQGNVWFGFVGPVHLAIRVHRQAL